MTGARVADVAVDLAVELVRIHSVNPSLVPGAAGEGAAVDRLAQRLGARGFSVESVPALGTPGRPGLVAKGSVWSPCGWRTARRRRRSRGIARQPLQP